MTNIIQTKEIYDRSGSRIIPKVKRSGYCYLFSTKTNQKKVKVGSHNLLPHPYHSFKSFCHSLFRGCVKSFTKQTRAVHKLFPISSQELTGYKCINCNSKFIYHNN